MREGESEGGERVREGESEGGREESHSERGKEGGREEEEGRREIEKAYIATKMDQEVYYPIRSMLNTIFSVRQIAFGNRSHSLLIRVQVLNNYPTAMSEPSSAHQLYVLYPRILQSDEQMVIQQTREMFSQSIRAAQVGFKPTTCCLPGRHILPAELPTQLSWLGQIKAIQGKGNSLT